ncbi:MAG: peroxidase-related enzyme [Planctomycetota bacterium]
MTFIEVIHEADATGKLAELYQRFGSPDGTVDNVLKAHAINPDSLEAHIALYVQSLHRPSPLSRAERELVGTAVSDANGCTYCREHHGRGAERLLPDDRKEVARAVMAGDYSTLTDRERAMVDYAVKLTRTPAEITAADVDALRDAGLTDREVLDLAQVVGYFCYGNRIVLGLGAKLEDESRLGQWPKEGGTSA